MNIHLKKKPSWFVSRTVLATVPVLEEADGSIVSESLVAMEYLDEKYPQPPLFPADPVKKAQEKVLVQVFSSKVGLFRQSEMCSIYILRNEI